MCNPLRIGLWVCFLSCLSWSRPAQADISVAPGPDGSVGAWLGMGLVRVGGRDTQPAFSLDEPLPEGLQKQTVHARAEERLPSIQRLRWQVLASSSNTFDLGAFFKDKGHEAIALVSGVLRVSAPWQGYILLGASDGIALYIDGSKVFSYDASRPFYPDNDAIPVKMEPGDHSFLLKLHHRNAPKWELRVRLVDRALAAARGVRFVLPGDIPLDPIVTALADVQGGPGIHAKGYTPFLQISFPNGIPETTDRAIRVKTYSTQSRASLLMDLQAGNVPLEAQGPVSAFSVALPQLDADGASWGINQNDPVLMEATVGGHRYPFEITLRPDLCTLLERADSLKKIIEKKELSLKDPDATLATLEALTERLIRYTNQGDKDREAQLEEAHELGRFLDLLQTAHDPFLELRGAHRVAYRSRLDGKPSVFGLFIPPEVILDGSKHYPLIVALHGLNGKPMSMMRWFFGQDDPSHDTEWEDRHAGSPTAISAFVVTPTAYGNSGYRDIAEEDVIDVLTWVQRMFPIDPARVSITGPSMGGSGTAEIGFRYADRFASAAPLCGYHSFFLRNDVAGRKLQRWETPVAEQRSNALWAENGFDLPLYIVHGTRDLPVANSGVLIDRYKQLGYPLREDHPEAGHNVWQMTYAHEDAFHWLSSFQKNLHPAHVVFKTDDLRYDHYAWVRVMQLERSLQWGKVQASIHVAQPNSVSVEVKSSGVGALHLERDPQLFPTNALSNVHIDGSRLQFSSEEPLDMVKGPQGAWQKGLREQEAMLFKQRALAGPLRDVFHEPLVVVFGTQDPLLTRANEEVAQWFAAVRPGTTGIHYPVMADTQFDPTLASSHALVLVGGASSNAITRVFEGRLPIHISTTPPEVRTVSHTWQGDELGAAFIYPNPDHPDRYVVILAGTSVSGTLRAMSLPELLPDFVIYDHALEPARGQTLVTPGAVRAAGMFEEDWGLPKDL